MAEDIEFVENRIRLNKLQQQKIAEEHEAFREEMGVRIRKVLQDAGVLDAVQSLEQAREQRRLADQAQVDALGKNVVELEGILAFLKGRSEAAPKKKVPASPPASARLAKK